MIDRADEDRLNPRAPFNQPDDDALNKSNVNDFFEPWQIGDVEQI